VFRRAWGKKRGLGEVIPRGGMMGKHLRKYKAILGAKALLKNVVGEWPEMQGVEDHCPGRCPRGGLERKKVQKLFLST